MSPTSSFNGSFNHSFGDSVHPMASVSPWQGQDASQGRMGLGDPQDQGQAADAVEAYFECITTCSLDDQECITVCTTMLRDQN